MARKCVNGRGSSRPRSFGPDLRRPHESGHTSASKILHCSLRQAAFWALCLVVLGVGSGLQGQTGTADEVHIAPRVQPEKAKEAFVDPSLNTHTRPIRRDVDLVLVPVTITDPMNRLVTGPD